ncbi:hypothetical protein [Tenacibaculum piscium]|uniref:hypothetical protein n=1 Tax=Tenacibaculum TaxID=104267 RepID=UPI001F358EAB|nr:hypothetical protein [Tenacibaculum piscium]MCG8184434.1 hypothetical protein [Tenacibaculum piscium]MCG8205828.1 hypothetical protein [Tenacibaculum piscium]
MKQFIYLFIALVLNSCVDQETPETNYTIINNTSQDVKIEPFSRDRNNGILTGSFVRADILEISKNSSKKIIREVRDSRTFYSLENVDSIKIVFGNSKFLTIDCNDWPSMENCNTIFRGGTDYNHSITEEDYENAEDCNGNCE